MNTDANGGDAESRQDCEPSTSRRNRESLPFSLRVALWLVYGKRCAYTHEPIRSPNDVEVDHVLPWRLVNDPIGFQAVRRAFGLPDNFTVDGNLENYVPTTSRFNKLKRDRTETFDMVPLYNAPYRMFRPYEDYGKPDHRSAHDLIAHGLALAKQNAEAVKRIAKLVSEMAKVGAAHADAPPDLRDAAFEYLVMHVVGRLPSGPFPVDDQDDSSGHVRYSRNGVILACHLPGLPDLAGRALVQFAEPSIRDALITLGHEDVIKRLLPGFGIGHHAGQRPFLVDQQPDDRWAVQLPHVRVSLPAEHVADFCDVIDLLASRYITSVEDVETHVLRSNRFPYAGRGYRLYRLPHWLWLIVLRFGAEHGVDSGGSEWIDSDRYGSSLSVYRRSPDGDGRDLLAAFHVELDIDSLIPVSLPDHVYVCWDPRPLHDVWARLWRRRSSEVWDAEEAHDWISRLIVAAARHEWENRAQRVSTKQSGISRLLNTVMDRRSVAFDPVRIDCGESQRTPYLAQNAGAAFRSYHALRETVSAMQRHFHGIERAKDARVGSLVGIYRFLDWCVTHAAALSLSSDRITGISHALGRHYRIPLASFIAEHTNMAVDRGCADSVVVDFALRAVIEVLLDPIDGDAEDAVVDSAVTHLSSLYEDYRFQAYLTRMASRPW